MPLTSELKCKKCGHSVYAFENFDSNPNYLGVMRFIMEHSEVCMSEFIISHDCDYLEGFCNTFEPYKRALKDVKRVLEMGKDGIYNA